jgi:N-methylhydantoinase A
LSIQPLDLPLGVAFPDAEMTEAVRGGVRIGVDVGGTFTDFVIADPDGSLTLWKEPSTPADPTVAVMDGLHALAQQRGLRLSELLAQTRLLVHGTTIATNQVLERRGSTVGLLATHGFRDVLELRDGYKPDRYNLRIEPPAPLIERHLRLGIRERVDREGRVVTPLQGDDVRAAARTFADNHVEVIAVAFLWSFMNPAHERLAAEILQLELPETEVLLSVDILPELREWPRTSATALSAYIKPGIAGYLRRLEAELVTHGLSAPLCVMQLNGGCATVEELLRRPVYALHSGPAAAPAAAAEYGRLLGEGDLISVDLGGTSFDVAVMRGGISSRTRTLTVDGNPVGVTAVEVLTVGAGGGSIAYVDEGGALHVGPRSAGSVPGPAAYDAGGGEPTVTDAHVVLGHLDPGEFLGGRRRLNVERAFDAIAERVAVPLGIEVAEAAAGIIRLVDTNMVTAIRAMSVERGIDPRGFALLTGGGAGALHAAALARTLGMRTVIVPRAAGTLCAFGMTVTDVVHDVAIAHHSLASLTDPAALAEVFAELEKQALRALRRQGFDQRDVTLERSVDVRYPGQVHELVVEVTRRETVDLTQVSDSFNADHRRMFGYSRPELELELLHCRVRASGTATSAAAPVHSAGGAAAPPAAVATRSRAVYLPERGERVAIPVYDAEALSVGMGLDGRAIVTSPTTTILVPDDCRLRVPHPEAFLVDVGAPR